MRNLISVTFVTAIVAASVTRPLTSTTISREEQQMTSLTGKTIQWTFVDGPTAGITFEHEFHEDGSVTWTYVAGPQKGATKREKAFAAVKVNDRTWAVSYLAESGHTLTVILNFEDHRAIGFASNDQSWTVVHGTFEMMN